MTAFCGEFPNDDVDDCDLPDQDDLPVGHKHACPRCGRPWKLVFMFDCRLWQSVTFTDDDGNVVEP